MEQQKLFLTASDVLLAEQSDSQFLTVTMRMMSTRANLNGEGVTEAFIDEIVANPEKYMCTPLYADTGKLKAHQYRTLGHGYDRRTGKFLTDQIGGFCSFEKVNDEFGVSLFGEARIPKREEEICAAICELYSYGQLNFSFEITYVPEATRCEGSVMYVDADPRNALTGMAVVSVPAYPEATALNLVAEANDSETDDATDKPMMAEDRPNKQETNEVTGMPDEKLEVAEAQTEAEEVEVKAETAEAESAVTEAAEETSETVAESAEAMSRETVTVDTPVESAIERVSEPDPALADSDNPLAEPVPGDVPPAPPEKEHVVVTEVVEEYHTRITTLEKIVAEKDARIEELNQQLSDYEAIKAEVEEFRKAKAEQEHQAKVAKAESYAKRNGLSLEDEAVKAAVAELNYEALMDLAMASEPDETTAETAVASVVCDMKITDPYGGMVSSYK